MKNIGFIGVGVMGKSMVRNLLRGGYNVAIYTRSKHKVLDILQEGAKWCDTVADCAKQAELVITMLGYPTDVDEVYFGEQGLVAHAAPGTFLVDMTTTSPRQAEEIYRQAKAAGLSAMDAPVSGGDVGAKNATLSIMVGGDANAFEACLPIFECLGKNIIHEGPAGFGQHTKMANQIALAGAISGVCEAIRYSQEAGLDLQKMLDSISQGAAGSWQLSNMAPRMLKNDFDPGFFIKHYVKDLTIAAEEAELRNLPLGITQKVLEMYATLESDGMGDLGTQALLHYYKRNNRSR